MRPDARTVPHGVGLRRYWTVAGVLAALFLVAFLVAEQAGLPLAEPQPWLDQAGPAAATAGVGLLVADVVLPVPSSLVMVAHGALFGVALGTVLSLAGSVGAAAVAFAIGRAGGPSLTRLVGGGERRRADALLARWGALAIVLTRPVPILAETVTILAGASPLPWRRALPAAAIGSLPAALVYAAAGAWAATFATAALVFTGVLAVTAALWAWGRRRTAHAAPGAGEAPIEHQ